MALLWNLVLKKRMLSAGPIKILGILVILFFVGWNTTSFFKWMNVRQYSLETADRDFGAITNEGAVISGPYGPALSLDNDRGSVVHMFGVVKADKKLFYEFPITHLAMDQDNEKRAREDYPEIMDNAWQITKYILRGIEVKVFNISEGSPNPKAHAYVPSEYEIAQKFIAENNEDSAQVHMTHFIESGVANYSADMYVGDALMAADDFDRAIIARFRISLRVSP